MFEQGTLDTLKTLAKEIMISKSIQLEEEKVKEEIMISKSILEQDASSQLDLFINYAKNQKANYDLIQSAESVKAMLPVLMDQLIREGYIDVSDT